MRFALSSLLLAWLVACGGAANEPSETPAGSPTAKAPTQSAGSTPAKTNDSPKSDCASPEPVIAKSGTTIRQPVGSVQRFQLVYRGSDVGVTALRGVDMIIAPNDGPFVAGKNSGFWAEVRDASGKVAYSVLLQDPTRIEGPGDNGGFVNATVDKCTPKTILVDVPRSPSGSVLVIFGSPDGQPTASELARFTLE